VKTKRRVKGYFDPAFRDQTDSDLGATGILYTPKFFDVFNVVTRSGTSTHLPVA
jgi:hypothetical protein